MWGHGEHGQAYLVLGLLPLERVFAKAQVGQALHFELDLLDSVGELVVDLLELAAFAEHGFEKMLAVDDSICALLPLSIELFYLNKREKRNGMSEQLEAVVTMECK